MQYRFSAIRWAGVPLSLLLAGTGCSVHVDKSGNGEDKNVKISTPLGGIHVTKGDTVAADTGIATYPGARLASSDDHGDKSADIDMGFGDWQLRVKVASYETSDSQQKVVDFYRKALGSFGTVIECRGGTAVGSPAVTGDGLSCSDSDSRRTKINIDDDGDLTLKSGSRRHQHIVSFKKPTGGDTRFALIALDLPHESYGREKQSN